MIARKRSTIYTINIINAAGLETCCAKSSSAGVRGIGDVSVFVDAVIQLLRNSAEEVQSFDSIGWWNFVAWFLKKSRKLVKRLVQFKVLNCQDSRHFWIPLLLLCLCHFEGGGRVEKIPEKASMAEGIRGYISVKV